MNIRAHMHIAILLILIWMPSTVLADLIILKNGNQLKVENAWQEDDQIFFVLNDINASIPQSKVIRIETDREDPKTFNKSHHSASTSKTDRRGHLQDGTLLDQLTLKSKPVATSRPKANLTKICPPLHRKGIGDLEWGMRAGGVSGLEPKQTDSGLKDVVEYVRPSDGLKLGQAELTSIVYAFWRNKLYTVTLWTSGPSNYKSLRQAVFNQFGQGSRPDAATERYLWSNPVTDMMLKYIDDNEYGFFWMRGKEMDRKFKLSRMSGHTSYLKWMKSRK